MVNDILLSLKSKIYQGDRKNFNFDKYCLAHVAEHNRHASLVEYNVAPLKESMKIHYFEEGIKDPTLDAARKAILVNRTQFPDFDSIMQLYVTSKQSQKTLFPQDDSSPPSQVVVVEVEAAAEPVAVVAVGVTPMPDRGGLFLKLTLTGSLLSRTNTTPKKGTPSSQRPRRPSTGSSGTQERNVEPVLPVARSLVSVRPTFPTLLLPFPLLCRLFCAF